jgi:phosphohistidine phosphatase
MRVVLFRHGPAGQRDASRWPNDALRPLSPQGEQRTRLACAGLRKILGDGPATIVTSPLLRAARTAKLLAETLERSKVVTLDALAPGGSYRELIRFLAQRSPGELVVLVGHEPDLGKLAGVLLFGAPAALPLKKAGACLIQCVGEVSPGTGRLRWLLTPKLLRSRGRKGAKL